MAEFRWPGQRSGDPSHDLMLDFLGADIQVNPDAAAALLAQVNAIESGAETEYRRIGNLYDLRLNAGGATIENLYEEDRMGTVSFRDFATAALAWLAFVEK